MGGTNTIVAVYNAIQVKRGDNAPDIFIEFMDGDTPLDISGNIYKMSITATYDKRQIIKTFTIGDGFTLIDNTKLQVNYNFDYPGNFKYDLQCTYPDGSITTLMYGPFNVIDDVTV